MAYWGPPFIAEADQTGFARLAAVGTIGRIAKLGMELPELLGARRIPTQCDIRIGIATGEALVGSIGSEVGMSYTVMGDTVNLAARPGTREQDLRQPLSDLGGNCFSLWHDDRGS
jgi:adenylate cyclase